MSNDYDASRVSLADVLGRQEHYVVPNYQRPYTWEQNEVQELWDDLMSHYMNDIKARSGGYLLGSIVTLSTQSSKEHDIVHDIVDGQQRLVTLTLLLCAIRESIRKRVVVQRSESDRAILESLITEINTLVVDQDGEGLITLNDGNGTSALSEIQKQKYSHDNLKQLCITSKHDAVKLLIKNYEFLISDTDKLCDKCNLTLTSTGVDLIHAVQALRDIVNDVKDRSFFVRINIFNEDYSHQVFESLNSTGRPLNEADLIKSYLMKQLDNSRPTFKWQTTEWDEIMTKGGKKPDLLLYESLLSRPNTTSSKDPSKNHLYKFVKERYETVDKVKIYLKELKEDSKFIDMLNKPNNLPDKFPAELKHSFFGIAQIRARYIRRPIIAACREWGPTDRNTMFFVDCLLKFFFMYRTIGKGDIDTLKKIAKDTTHQIVRGDKLDTILRTILKSSKTVVSNNMDEKSFQTQFKNEIRDLRKDEAMYILMSLEHQLTNPGGISTTVAGSDLELEHIFPLRPSNKWPNSEKLETHRWRLGNLTMVPSGWNKQLSNHSFSEKKSGRQGNTNCYEKSGLMLNQQYLKHYEDWTLKEIVNREENLCELAFKVWTLEKYRKMAGA